MKIVRNIIILSFIILALAGIYFGSVRSLIKGQKYIEALSKRKEITSVETFKNIFMPVLKYRAPISDDETVKFISGDIVDIASSGKQQEEVVRELVAFIEPYAHKNDVIHILNIARTYHFMWLHYGAKAEYFKKTEEGYKKVLSMAPKLPPALYGMLDLYRGKGDKEKIKEYGNRILKLWPEDNRVVEALKIAE